MQYVPSVEHRAGGFTNVNTLTPALRAQNHGSLTQLGSVLPLTFWEVHRFTSLKLTLAMQHVELSKLEFDMLSRTSLALMTRLLVSGLSSVQAQIDA
eukprot:6034540-Amphidinium_carterae.1